jgi:hypothetical protein
MTTVSKCLVEKQVWYYIRCSITHHIKILWERIINKYTILTIEQLKSGYPYPEELSYKLERDSLKDERDVEKYTKDNKNISIFLWDMSNLCEMEVERSILDECKRLNACIPELTLKQFIPFIEKDHHLGKCKGTFKGADGKETICSHNCGKMNFCRKHANQTLYCDRDVNMNVISKSNSFVPLHTEQSLEEMADQYH